ncbi:MAG: response regulator [Verrucomicrobia bacterium]|jgi:phosphoribosyl 1,2-cyclic phosphodiesterase/CheY-like chemotaxis protein|nr:response regulator [Verrucomicrobiota bacterium]
MRRVLIIEDDADQREILAEFIRECGWEALLAADGESGLRTAQAAMPQVIFCDLLMHGLNGFQVCRSLRSDPAFRNTLIVVTSGRVFEADRLAAIESGADEYLQKPVPLDQIREVLGRIAESASPAPPAADDSSGITTMIRFWGVRGSIPTPGPGTVHFGGNTSCVEVRADGQIIILDAGTGLRALGRHLVEEFKDTSLPLNLLLSHTHWDHIQGLPYFAPLYRPHAHLRVFGYEGARSSLSTVLSSQMESPFFPVGLQDVPSHFEIEELRQMKFNLGRVQVDSWFANHPGICVGYRLTTTAGKVAFFPDNEPPTRQQQVRAAAGLPEEYSAAYAQSEEARLIGFLKGVDVLIMDAQYTPEEYTLHVGWGHGCVDDVVKLALAAEVGHLFLFHHDPDHHDDTLREIEARARHLVKDAGGRLEVQAAREGFQFVLPCRTAAR